MEKFIKQYGILILVGVAVYWFFIREKEEEVVVVDEGETSNLGGDCGQCKAPTACCNNPAGWCTKCAGAAPGSVVGDRAPRGRGRSRAQFKYPNFRYKNRNRRVNI